MHFPNQEQYRYDDAFYEAPHRLRVVPPTQTTMSFRSSSSEGDSVLDDQLLSGGTWARVNSLMRSPWLNKKSKHDTGHPFRTERIWYDGLSIPEHPGYSGTHYPLIPRCEAFTDVLALDDISFVTGLPSLVNRGVQAIRDTQPTKSPAALAEALVELSREGLPKVRRVMQDLTRARSLSAIGSAAGSAHLTREFGLKPLIRDLQDVLDVFQNHDRLLIDYQEGAGKKQHRQRYWDTETFTQEELHDSNQALICDMNGSTVQRLNIYSKFGLQMSTTRSVSVTDYFKGAYIYHLPPGLEPDGVRRFMHDFGYLLGLDVDFGLLWEVAPWSWLSDWVLNLGDNISNAQALSSDSLVLLYGYVMRETRVTNTRTTTGLADRSGQPLGPATITYNNIVKERIRASPYGFGIDPIDFTARQWSILGALGMTKGENSLRLND